MTVAVPAIGTQLQLYNGTSYTTVAEVTDITFPEIKAELFDTTNMTSPGTWEETLPTILRSGSLQFTINYVPTDPTHNAATGLISYLTAKTLTNIKLIMPNAAATTWTLPGYVESFKAAGKLKDALTATVSFKVSGQPTLN